MNATQQRGTVIRYSECEHWHAAMPNRRIAHIILWASDRGWWWDTVPKRDFGFGSSRGEALQNMYDVMGECFGSEAEARAALASGRLLYTTDGCRWIMAEDA